MARSGGFIELRAGALCLFGGRGRADVFNHNATLQTIGRAGRGELEEARFAVAGECQLTAVAHVGKHLLQKVLESARSAAATKAAKRLPLSSSSGKRSRLLVAGLASLICPAQSRLA